MIDLSLLFLLLHPIISFFLFLLSDLILDVGRVIDLCFHSLSYFRVDVAQVAQVSFILIVVFSQIDLFVFECYILT